MSITHTRATTTVVLFQGSDLDSLAERRAAFQRASVEQLVSRQPLRIGDETEPSQAAEKAKAYDEYLDEALERATHVKLAALPRKGTDERKGFRDLLADHPPRAAKKEPGTLDAEGKTVPGQVIEEYERDHQLGFDVDGMAEPLIMGCLRAWDEDSRPEGEMPQFETDRARQAFVDSLDDPSFAKLYSAAVKLNQTGGPDPKVRLSSLLDRMLSETSDSLSPSED